MTDKNKTNEPGQSKSETTAAAQTIFNLPEQPQRPITTDNLSKTIDKAVSQAFARQEKKDTKDLIKGPQAAVNKPKVKSKAPTPHNLKETNKSPVSSKPKIKLKNPTPYNEVPEKKKITTPSGISINALALGLQEQQKAAKPKIKLKTPTPYNSVEPFKAPEIKEQEKKETANKMLDATLGPLAERSTPISAVPVKNPQHSAAINVLQKKVENIEEDKAEKIAAPEPKVESVAEKAPEIKYSKEQSKQDAAEALKSLGYKKNEFQHILDQLDHIEKTEDKILMTLKLKGNPHAKIPKPEVPAAIAEVEKETQKPKEEPKVESVKKEEEPKVTPVVPEPVVTPTPSKPVESNSASSDADQQKAENDKEIEDAKKARKAQEKREKEIKAELDEIKKKLGHSGIADLIAMAIGYLGSKLLKLIGSGLWKLVKMAGKVAWDTVKLAWKGAKTLFNSIKSLLKGGEKAGLKAGEKAAEKGGEKLLVKEGEKVAAEEGAKVGAKTLGKSLLKKIPIIGAIAGLGFAAADLLEGDTTGAALDAASGLVSTIPGIGTAASVAIDAYGAGRDLGIVGNKPVAKSDDAAGKLAGNNTDSDSSDEEDAQPPVVVHQDNRKTIVQNSNNDEPNVLINVRNDEPSASGLVSSLFDHPASWGAVYRM